MKKLLTMSGFTLTELVIVIVIIGIIGTVALREMLASIDDARFEQTRSELDQLAFAIVGNPALHTSGARSDFGYVGDVGALPPDLNALVANPGGFSTWDGPYIIAGAGPGDNPSLGSHLSDAWNVAYTYPVVTGSGVAIRSSGSAVDIDRVIAPAASDLLSNTVSGFITDANRQPPGPVYRDSVAVLLTYPDGAGSMTTAGVMPSADGSFGFSGIPVGNHTLRIVYVPSADTTAYSVCVTPGSEVKLDVAAPMDLW